MIKKIVEYLRQLFVREEELPLRNRTYVYSKFGEWGILIERVK